MLSGGGVVGVLAGGVLTDVLSWHWIFLANLPVGVLVYALSVRLLPKQPGFSTGRVDVAGAITVTASLMLAVYAIVNANEEGWTSGETVGVLSGAALLFAVFFVVEARIASPLMPLGLFRNGNWAVDILPATIAVGLGAGIAFNPILLAATSGVPQERAGLASGVVNTAFMMGGALGLAVLASLADRRTESLLTTGESALPARNSGYRLAFVVGAVFVVISALVGASLLRVDSAPAHSSDVPAVLAIAEAE